MISGHFKVRTSKFCCGNITHLSADNCCPWGLSMSCCIWIRICTRVCCLHLCRSQWTYINQLCLLTDMGSQLGLVYVLAASCRSSSYKMWSQILHPGDKNLNICTLLLLLRFLFLFPNYLIISVKRFLIQFSFVLLYVTTASFLVFTFLSLCLFC